MARQRRRQQREQKQNSENQEFFELLTGTLKPSEMIHEEKEAEKPSKPGILAGDQTMSRSVHYSYKREFLLNICEIELEVRVCRYNSDIINRIVCCVTLELVHLQVYFVVEVSRT